VNDRQYPARPFSAASFPDESEGGEAPAFTPRTDAPTGERSVPESDTDSEVTAQVHAGGGSGVGSDLGAAADAEDASETGAVSNPRGERQESPSVASTGSSPSGPASASTAPSHAAATSQSAAAAGSPSISSASPLNREQILTATRRVLERDGYEKTTIRRIAAELGCAVGSIYRHFHDKRELLLAVTSQILEPVTILVDAGGATPQTAAMYHRQACHDPLAYRLMFWLSGLGDPQSPLPPIVRGVIEQWARRLGDEAIALQAWAVLHGAVTAGLSETRAVAMFMETARRAEVKFESGADELEPSAAGGDAVAASPGSARPAHGASPATASGQRPNVAEVVTSQDDLTLL